MRQRKFVLGLAFFFALAADLAARPLLWETVDLPRQDHLIEVFVADGYFVAHGKGGTVLRSLDGRLWDDVSLPASGDLGHGVSWNGRWVMSGADVGIWVSEDQGQSWTEALLPVLSGDSFRPESVIVQSNGDLLSIGELPAAVPGPCWRTVATSADGLTWVLQDQYELFGEHQDAIAVDGGIINAIFYGSLPECSAIPIIEAFAFDFYQGDASSGLALLDRVELATLAVQRRAAVWHQNELRWIGQTLVQVDPVLYQYWIARAPLDVLNPQHDRLTVGFEPFSVAIYRDQIVVGHVGRVSFVSMAGAVDEQLLPVPDRSFRFASQADVLLGVGEGGLAVRGVPPPTLAVPIDDAPLLLLLAALALLVGLGAISSSRAS
ncbi:MAG: hypothetical protein AAGJ52_14345 [Pseudomonadota bacterium]